MSETLLHLNDYPPNPHFCETLPLKFLKEQHIFPLTLDGNRLSVAMADPTNMTTVDAIQLATGYEVIGHPSSPEDILQAITKLYQQHSAMGEIIGDMQPENQELAQVLADDHGEDDIKHLQDVASEAPVIRLVNLIITRALDARASDIHFEPFERQFQVRYRVDGVLHDAEAPPAHLQAAITSRIKIMAKLNIAERRLPQDGRIKLKIGGKHIDFRISTLPTMHGESVVMRILDRGNLTLDLISLGFPDDIRSKLEKMITRPYGMILVTGPTGSGKTTTLYTTLAKINSPEKKIITIEDPIEYQLRGVNQIQTKPEIGLSFANGLRSIVRQDPDVIMVGEIRDRETAEIAIQSALTGHLVFSTLHTNDAPGAITRLLEMGIEDYLLASSIIGVLAQRLVRLICSECKVPFEPDPGFLKEYHAIAKHLSTPTFQHGKGCRRCSDTGYYGRSGIYELLPCTDDIRKLIIQRPEAKVLRDTALQEGMRTLREDGWRKIADGLTTIDEVRRVTQED